MPTVFINYRRSDSSAIAGRIYDRLTLALGEANVFKDSYDIDPGEDFRGKIRESVGTCDVLLAIIGPTWLDVRERDDPTMRRLDNPNDWVRLEIETCLQRDSARVIPVLVQGASMPGAKYLPDTMRELAYKNAFPVRDDPDFPQDLNKLITFLKSLDAPKIPEKPASPASATQKRLLEAAMPACSTLGTETQLKVKISLPDSPGLRAELPQVLPSGDIIQQSDVLATGFAMRFPKDEAGNIQPGNVCVVIETDDFTVLPPRADSKAACEEGQVSLRVLDEADSRTLNFKLIPKSPTKIGLSTVSVVVYQYGQLLVDTTVQTHIVASMNDLPICGDWRLNTAKSPASPSTGTYAPPISASFPPPAPPLQPITRPDWQDLPPPKPAEPPLESESTSEATPVGSVIPDLFLTPEPEKRKRETSTSLPPLPASMTPLQQEKETLKRDEAMPGAPPTSPSPIAPPAQAPMPQPITSAPLPAKRGGSLTEPRAIIIAAVIGLIGIIIAALITRPVLNPDNPTPTNPVAVASVTIPPTSFVPSDTPAPTATSILPSNTPLPPVPTSTPNPVSVIAPATAELGTTITITAWRGATCLFTPSDGSRQFGFDTSTGNILFEVKTYVAGTVVDIGCNDTQGREARTQFTVVATGSPTNTPTPPPDADAVTLHLFVERDTLTLYIPESISLVGLTFTVAETGETNTLVSAFPLLQLTNNTAEPNTCFVYRRAGTASPLSGDCDTTRTFRLDMANADVFWYDSVSNQPQNVAIYRDNTLIGICSAAQADCTIDWPRG